MRRLEIFALALACLLALSSCGGETDSQKPVQDPPPQDSGEDMTVYDCAGLEVALPNAYLDQLLVDTDFPDAPESWKPLISVYEKTSYETAMEDFGGGGGFLFGFLAMDQAAFEQHISSDGSGIDVFATDGERYYAYTFPTDVQFYRPDAESVPDHPDWPVWEKLCELGPQVREDFLTRNNLQSFDLQDFLGRLDEGEDHVVLKYYPYFAKDGDTRVYDQLLLRQPARQGEGGIWAVDQWLDGHGNQSLYFPDSGKPAAEHYAELQKQCDAGEHPELLTPAGAAAAFVEDYFGHETLDGSFEEIREVDQGYMERNERLQGLVLDLEFRPEDVDGMDLLSCVGEATADNWGALGRFMYGSDWFQPLMDAVAEAAVGQDQQTRNKAVMSLFLATKDARTDFRTPLDEILQAQAEADFSAFTAALAEFPEEDQTYIQFNTTVLK
ncbi:hypothetical protein [Oscillibacter sp.]|uniref:hypothetical protein n=1 Tax=Oscillibacter sp. TaxID=1945593 RepID=UPI002D7EC041|nr:hypothetical protein [Oscillibacter sp.]